MPSSQRPLFLSSFLAAFRPQPTPAMTASAQSNKHTHPTHPSLPTSSGSPSAARSMATTPQQPSAASQPQSPPSQRGVMTQLPLHSPRPIPTGSGGGAGSAAAGRRRGSDSSSEGFRDTLQGDKWYVGGRTAAGDERFFKLGVVRRVRSQDRLSLDRLSL